VGSPPQPCLHVTPLPAFLTTKPKTLARQLEMDPLTALGLAANTDYWDLENKEIIRELIMKTYKNATADNSTLKELSASKTAAKILSKILNDIPFPSRHRGK
jgi:hypothetical protein